MAAVLLGVMTLAGPSLGRPGQFLYLAVVTLPAVLAAIGELHLHARRSSPTTRDTRTLRLLSLLIVLWAGWRLAVAWKSPLVANGTDCHPFFDSIHALIQSRENFVSSDMRQGVHALFIMLVAGAWVPALLGEPMTLHLVMILQVSGIALTGWVIAWLLVRVGLRTVAPFAVATFLFSPWMLDLPLFATLQSPVLPLGLGMLALLHEVRTRASDAALIGLATLVAISMLHAGLLPAACLIGAATAWGLRRSARPTPVAMAVALICLFSIAGPRLPNFGAMTRALDSYATASQLWSGIEAGYYGYFDTRLVEFQVNAGSPGRWDILLGALLAPFATPRSALRLIGDAILDPIGGAATALGVALTLRLALRHRLAGFLLLLCIALGCTGAISNYDRPSLTRMIAGVTLLPLFAAVALQHLRANVAQTRWLVPALVLTVGGGGTFLADGIVPRTLASSPLAVFLELASKSPPTEFTLLTGSPWDPLQSRLIAPSVASPNLAIAAYANAEELARIIDGGSKGVVLWTPAQEDQDRIQQTVCGADPQSRNFILTDRAGLTRAFASVTSTSNWQPPLAEVRWQLASCSTALPTEAAAAARALQQADVLLRAGRRQEAVATLRDTAEETFVQRHLYQRLAEVLSEAGQNEADEAEAKHWRRRAALLEKVEAKYAPR